MLKNRIKEIALHSAVYSAVSFASAFTSIALLPVYTKFLSKNDYGILELLDYTNMVLLIVVVAGLNIAVPRFYNYAKTDHERKSVLSTSILFVSFAGFLLCLFGFLFDRNLAVLILGSPEYETLVDLNLAIFYAQLVLYVSSLGFITTKNSKVYLIYMIGKLCLTVAVCVYFVAIKQLGVLGMLYGSLIGNSIIGLAVFIHNMVLNGIRFKLPILSGLLWFGFPLIPATLLATILHNADRFLIKHFCSLDDVGVYGIGYKFPFMLNLLILQSFSFIWTGATMYEISKQEDSGYQYGRITTYVIGIYFVAQLSLGLFSELVVKVLVDDKFFAANRVIPLVGLGLCFHAFYFFFSVGSFLKKKAWLINAGYVPAALFNVTANIIFLPRYGYIAAAWITMLTYFVFALGLYFSCKHLIKIKYEFKRLGFLFVFGFGTFVFSSFYTFENIFFELIKGLFFLTLFLAGLFLVGWFTDGERKVIRETFLFSIRALMKIRKSNNLSDY